MVNKKDGMRYPSIDDLIEKTSSKYLLVVGAAKRARDIEREGKSYISSPHNKKSIGIALEEIAEDKIVIYDSELESHPAVEPLEEIIEA